MIRFFVSSLNLLRGFHWDDGARFTYAGLIYRCVLSCYGVIILIIVVFVCINHRSIYLIRVLYLFIL